MARMQPIGKHDYNSQQSRFEHAPSLPTRMSLAGPYGAGKGVVMHNWCLNLYKHCVASFYVFSPSVHLDRGTWDPVKEYVATELKQDADKEPCCCEDWAEGKLRNILAEHTKIIELLKQRKGVNKLPSIADIIVDFADSPKVAHSLRTVITSLFVRGRPAMVSTFASIQQLRAISTPCSSERNLLPGCPHAPSAGI